MSIYFTKMHGLGNDFVIIDAITQNFIPTKEIIKNIADRHYGIGCDQVLLVEKAQDSETDFYMRILNADGLEAEQCGNGARCFAKFVINHGLINKNKILVSTKGGKLEMWLEENDDVRVNLGIPSFLPSDVPFLVAKEELIYNLKLSEKSVPIGVLSIGNPHAILNVSDLENISVEKIGSEIALHRSFPQSINVSFMQIQSPSNIKLRIYERGSGETLACGSGATAAVIIGRLWGFLDEEVIVNMKGGELLVCWKGKGSPVYLRGAAVEVFTGNYEYSS